jgi:3alpha(or 20beta)-hydroxysteroid dehydrogenase
MADIDTEKLVALAGKLGVGALPLPLDVANTGQWEEALDTVWSRWGGLDVLVNCAGIVRPGYVTTISVEDHCATIDSNFLGPLRGMVATLPRFLRQGSGRFVTVASMTAFLPFPGLASYAASKHALRAFHLGLAAEQRHAPIEFVLVHPGAVETPMLEIEAACDEAALAFASPAIQPDDVARKILAALTGEDGELFVPEERAGDLRAVAADPQPFLSGIDAGAAAGLARLRGRRSEATFTIE